MLQCSKYAPVDGCRRAPISVPVPCARSCSPPARIPRPAWPGRWRDTSALKPSAFSTASGMRSNGAAAAVRQSRIAGDVLHLGQRLGEDIVVDLAGYGALAESALTGERAIEMAAERSADHVRAGSQSGVPQRRRRSCLSARHRHAGRRHVRDGFFRLPRLPPRHHRRDAASVCRSGLNGRSPIETPLMHLTKAQTWALAHRAGRRRPGGRSSSNTATPAIEGDRSHAPRIGAMAAALARRASCAPRAGPNGAAGA